MATLNNHKVEDLLGAHDGLELDIVDLLNIHEHKVEDGIPR